MHNLLEKIKTWVLVHKRFPYEGSIADSENLAEAHVKLAIYFAYSCVCIGLLLFPLGLLVTLGVFTPATPGYNPIWASCLVTGLGLLVIQSMHIAATLCPSSDKK
ncbi:hypothetical protein ACT3UJ_06980 [Halomonas sp. 86]|uniref:hypothetical protein n=1 Tax=unclassified Halomonas TaxID=2609666 RepID=UPI004033EAE2